MDQADDKANRKIQCPLHALWGAEVTVGALWDVLATWREKSAAPVMGKALDCGHLFRTRPPRTLQNVIFISNRFYAKPHASH